MTNKKIAGIICEYNPFHNGHAYQIEEIRRRGYDTVVAVMSGNTVQRGEFAITDKYTRAKSALCGGADLVLELPYPYSASSTEFFATAGVRILSDIGVDSICFGSECGDLNTLREVAEIYRSKAFEDKYKDLVNSSLGVASAYFETYKQISGRDLPMGSNDILGVAYLRAIMDENIGLNIEVVKREGSAYRDSELTNYSDTVYPSALMIRNEIKVNGVSKDVRRSMPAESYSVIKEADIPSANDHLERVILSFFRLSNSSELGALKISETGGGLAEKLCKVSHAVQSAADLREKAMGGKYTLSRINRAIMHCMTGACEDDVRRRPAYTTVLGFNMVGKDLLGNLRKKSLVPIVTKPTDAPRVGEAAERQYALSLKADALYSLCFDKIRKSSEYITESPIIIL